MKLTKPSIVIGSVFILLTICLMSNHVESSKLYKSAASSFLEKNEGQVTLETSNEKAERRKHKKKMEKTNTEQAPPAITVSARKNETLVNATYKRLNETFVKQDFSTFMSSHRKWDWKILDKQLEEIYQDMNYQQQIDHTEKGVRAFLQIFVTQFQNCDTNYDNILNLSEFLGCMANDTYLNEIQPPPAVFSPYVNYTWNNATGFYPILFQILDTHHTGYMTFHGYMTLRLMRFSWKKCSVMAPFIEEINFECAIEIASGYKTLPRNSVRRLFSLGLELSNSESLRNLDFITYLLIASSVRLYGFINGKEDSDISRSEFNLALDSNILPMRYNQDIINQIFSLVEEADKPNQGIDIQTFVFLDFFLGLFDMPVFGEYKKARPYLVNATEFMAITNHYLFPMKTLLELKKIPQNVINANSYQMYTYLNISNFHSEADHFIRSFVETDEKIMYKNRNRFGGAKKLENFRFKSRNSEKSQLGKDNILNIIGKNPNLKYSPTNTTLALFNMLDADLDGYLNFYDFGNFMQMSYLFTKFDIYNKGRIVAGELMEKFSTWADFPTISYKMKEKAKRFNMIPMDLYLDLSMVCITLRIEDIVNTITRRGDKTTLFEYELKSMFSFIRLKDVPDTSLNKCLRGTDPNNIPLYDWECAFIKGVIAQSLYYESSYAYLTTKNRNLTLTNTVFVNTDPAIA
jgi:hypothetical protein